MLWFVSNWLIGAGQAPPCLRDAHPPPCPAGRAWVWLGEGCEEALGLGVLIGQWCAIFARKEPGAGGGGHWGGVQDVHMWPGACGFGLPAARQGDLCGLGGPVCAKEFAIYLGVFEKERGAGMAQERGNIWDQLPGGGDIAGHGFGPIAAIKV